MPIRKKSLTNMEFRIISELMINSRRSDREIAKAIGTSQPTVSRAIKKLENQGIIKEYTMIPDFRKLGYNLMTMTLIKYRQDMPQRDFREVVQSGVDNLQSGESPEVVMTEQGMGMGHDVLVLAYEKDYSEYRQLVQKIRAYSNVQHVQTSSFIIDLNDTLHYRPFTYSTIAKHLLNNHKPV